MADQTDEAGTNAEGSAGLEVGIGTAEPATESLAPDTSAQEARIDVDVPVADTPSDVSEATVAAAPTAPQEAGAPASASAAAQVPVQASAAQNPNVVNIKNIQSIKVRVEAILGGVDMTVSQLSEVKQNDLIPLDACLGDEVDLWANGVLIGRGEIVVLEEEVPRFGITLTKLVNTKSTQAAE